MYSKKIRKPILCALSSLLALTTLGSCTQSDEKVYFRTYWTSNIEAPEENIQEELTYQVSFKKNDVQNDYQIDYKDGIYTAKLSMETLENGTTIYVYQTSLQIDVTYTYKTQTAEFTDNVLSTVRFHKTNEGLRPISVHKEIVSHSPLQLISISSLENCYTEYILTIDTLYNETSAGGETTVVDGKTQKEKKTSFALDTEKYTCLDNEQLLFALRGLNPSTFASPKFSVYAPFSQRAQTVGTTFSAVTSNDFEFTKNGERKKYNIYYYPVSVALKENNPGATQTLWIASNSKNKPVDYYNVILRMETPISYSLGTLVYELTSANFSK